MNIVQNGGEDMKQVVTSKEAILEVSRKLIMDQGWTAVNIRSVAAACGVSVGSIYNYFPSKSDLVAAAIESVWRQIFHVPGKEADFQNFLECMEWIFQSMAEGARNFPGFFTLHSMSLMREEKTKGQRLMQQSREHMQQSLYKILLQDESVSKNAFNEILTPQKFIELIFSLVISAMLTENYDSSAIKELIRRSIYEC